MKINIGRALRRLALKVAREEIADHLAKLTETPRDYWLAFYGCAKRGQTLGWKGWLRKVIEWR